MTIRIIQSEQRRASKAEVRAIMAQVKPNFYFSDSTDLSNYGLPFLETVERPESQPDHRVVAGPDEEYEPGKWRTTWIQEPIDLDQVKAEARAQVDAKEAEKRQSFPWDFGEPFGVLHLQIRGIEDQANWLTLQNKANKHINDGDGATSVLGIRTEENVTVPVTADEAYAITDAMAAFGGNTKFRAWQLKDMLSAAINKNEVQNIIDTELNTGWPIDDMPQQGQ